MELTLFTIICQHEDCGYTFISNSEEHRLCPYCGEENVVYDDGIMTIEVPSSQEEVEDYLNYAIESKGDLALAVILANASVVGDSCVARFDDYQGFRLNLTESDFLNQMIAQFGLTSMDEFEEWVEEEVYDIHASLIFDPVIEYVSRDHYVDESGNLFESGHIEMADSEAIYEWIQNHPEQVNQFLK